MKKYLLSICIPTYNRADALERCIDAIVNNPAFTGEMEIFVSDNNSSDNTQQLMENYCSQYKNITYVRQKENIGGERNFIFVLEHANGEFLKLHNDWAIFTTEGFEHFVNAVREAKAEGTLIYLHNSMRRKGSQQCKSLDEFLRTAALSTAWIGSYGYWSDDFLSLPDKDQKIASQFMQIDWFLRLFEKKKQCMVYSDLYSDRYDFKANHGDYNMFKIKNINFLEMFEPYVQKGVVSVKTLDGLKRAVYNNSLQWIHELFIKRNSHYTYDRDGAFKLLYDNYHRYYWFYLDALTFYPKKILFAIISKLHLLPTIRSTKSK